MMYLLAVMNDSDGPLLIALAVAALVVILATSSNKKRPTIHAEMNPTAIGSHKKKLG